MTFSRLSCSHPLFKWASRGAWHQAPKGLKRPHVFVFERDLWLVPSEVQIAEYRLAKRIVEQLGGHMSLREHELAGKAKPLSLKDVKEILTAVRRDHPAAKVIAHWNGQGSYAMSVGVDFRTPRPRNRGTS